MVSIEKEKVLSQPPKRFRNKLLQSMRPEDLAMIQPFLTAVSLDIRRPFESPGKPIDEVCFPETAIISVVANNAAGRMIETGLIGFEGMTGVAIILGDDQSPNEAYVQVAGNGQILAAEDLKSVFQASSGLRLNLMRYAHTFMVQTAQTALANGRAKIDERLARWLLMASDRVGSSDIALTHDFLSVMLGVRRPGVTDALHRLESEHLIRSRRSSINIRDRSGLESRADGSYGASERTYERLFGSFRNSGGAPPEAMV